MYTNWSSICLNLFNANNQENNGEAVVGCNAGDAVDRADNLNMVLS